MNRLENAFTQDHNIIDQMLNEFAQTSRINDKNQMQLFNDLRNAINKHMKEEEGIHQTIINKSNYFEDIIKSTKEQHREITKILDEMCYFEDYEPEEKEQKINELIYITKQHHKFEEEYIYSKIDNLLDEKEKERIIFELESKVKRAM